MKKILIYVLIALLAVGATLGIVFGVKNFKDKGDENVNNISYKLLALEDKAEYTVGDDIVFDFYAFADVQFTTLKYSINNGNAVTVTGAKTGNKEDHEASKRSSGKYFIDSTYKIIDTDSMSAGWYTIVFTALDSEGTVYTLNKIPYMFKLNAAPSSD